MKAIHFPLAFYSHAKQGKQLFAVPRGPAKTEQLKEGELQSDGRLGAELAGND